MTLWLTSQELEELTGFKTSRKQKQALAQMGISFRSRPDGFPIVDRAQFATSHTVLKNKEKRRTPKLEFVQQ